MPELVAGSRQIIGAGKTLEAGTRQIIGYQEIIAGRRLPFEYYGSIEAGNRQIIRNTTVSLLNTYVVPNPIQWDTLEAGLATALTLPKVLMTLHLFHNGTVINMTPYVFGWKLSRRFGGKATFSCRLLEHSPGGFDSDGYPLPDVSAFLQVANPNLNPLFLGRGTFANKIINHKYDYSRYAVITLHTQLPNGSWWPKVMPPMLMGTPKLSGEEGILEWAGEDPNALWERPGNYQQAPPKGILPAGSAPLMDIVPGDNIFNLAHATIRQIGKAVGQESFIFNFPDFAIRQLRFSSSTPRSWREDIEEIYQAFAYFQGATMVIEPAKDCDKVAPQWHWQDYLNVMGCTIELMEGWKNKFTVSRMKDQSGTLKERTVKAVGEYTITDFEPSNYVNLRIRVVGDAQLSFRNFRFYAGQRLVQATLTQTAASSPYKIDRIVLDVVPFQFGVQQLFGGSLMQQVGDPNALRSYEPTFQYIVTGGSEATAIDDFSDEFTYTELDERTAAVFGVIEDFDNIESSITPNRTVARHQLDALLFENVRRIFKMTFATPYVNAEVEPNSVHSMTSYRTGQVGEFARTPWLCEVINYSQEPGGPILQDFEMYRGLLPGDD